MWLRSETKRAVCRPYSSKMARTCCERLQGVAARVLEQDRRSGDAPGDGVAAASLRLGRQVARKVAAGRDQIGCVALLVELDGVVQAGGEGP